MTSLIVIVMSAVDRVESSRPRKGQNLKTSERLLADFINIHRWLALSAFPWREHWRGRLTLPDAEGACLAQCATQLYNFVAMWALSSSLVSMELLSTQVSCGSHCNRRMGRMLTLRAVGGLPHIGVTRLSHSATCSKLLCTRPSSKNGRGT